jgi:hypothetical protein
MEFLGLLTCVVHLRAAWGGSRACKACREAVCLWCEFNGSFGLESKMKNFGPAFLHDLNMQIATDLLRSAGRHCGSDTTTTTATGRAVCSNRRVRPTPGVPWYLLASLQGVPAPAPARIVWHPAAPDPLITSTVALWSNASSVRARSCSCISIVF